MRLDFTRGYAYLVANSATSSIYIHDNWSDSTGVHEWRGRRTSMVMNICNLRCWPWTSGNMYIFSSVRVTR